jgi:hypothetical protein
LKLVRFKGYPNIKGASTPVLSVTLRGLMLMGDWFCRQEAQPLNDGAFDDHDALARMLLANADDWLLRKEPKVIV